MYAERKSDADLQTGRGASGDMCEGREKSNCCGRAITYEGSDLYSIMRACGRYLYHCAGRGAGQGRILAILLERKSMTQKELLEMLQIQPGSMSEILTKLEEKGLIMRRRDEEDRRRSVLELTEAGVELALYQKRYSEGRPSFDVLTENEQEELKGMLTRLLESWLGKESVGE